MVCEDISLFYEGVVALLMQMRCHCEGRMLA